MFCRFFLSGKIQFRLMGMLVLVFLLFSFHSTLGGENEIEVLDHSWKTTEKWDKINKTRYSWSVAVKSHAHEKRKISIYYYLLDGKGRPLAMNTMTQAIQPNETIQIHGDSYVHNHRLPFIKGSRVKVKSKPFP